MDDDTPAPSKPKRRHTPLIGPLFSWDLVRLARRGQDARSRTILACVLLATLFVFTMIWFRSTDLEQLFFGQRQVIDASENQRFAEQFMLAMLLAQLAVMVLLTPAYAAGTIADEKERRTWQYLLCTDLSNREIILGKFFGRVVFLIGVLMAGLPVLALTALIGGIDPLFLGFGYLFTTSTVVMLSALGIAAAVYASTFRGAMFRSYGMTCLYVFFGCGLHPLLSPFAVLPMLYAARTNLSSFLFMGFGYMAIQLAIALGLLIIAVRRLRRIDRREPRQRSEEEVLSRSTRPRTRLPVAKPLSEERVIAHPVGEDRWGENDRRNRTPHAAPDWADKPRVDEDDPFTWKERHTTGTKRTVDDDSIQSLKIVIGIFMAIFLGVIVIGSALYVMTYSTSGVGTMSKLMVLTGLGGVFTHLFTLGPTVCGAILREKSQLTLEPLLTIPIPRTAILWPKWKVNFLRGWWWGAPGLISVVLGFVASDKPLVALPMGAYLLGVFAFAVGFGLWLSCRCTTVVRAVMIYMIVAGVLTLVPLVIQWQFSRAGSVMATMLTAVFAVVIAVTAYLFWRLSVNEFERYGRN